MLKAEWFVSGCCGESPVPWSPATVLSALARRNVAVPHISPFEMSSTTKQKRSEALHVRI